MLAWWLGVYIIVYSNCVDIWISFERCAKRFNDRDCALCGAKNRNRCFDQHQLVLPPIHTRKIHSHQQQRLASISLRYSQVNIVYANIYRTNPHFNNSARLHFIYILGWPFIFFTFNCPESGKTENRAVVARSFVCKQHLLLLVFEVNSIIDGVAAPWNIEW